MTCSSNQNIERFCSKNSITIDQWIEETISGTKLPEKRLLGSLLAGAKTGDLIEPFDDKRRENLDNYRLGDSIQAKILAFALGLSAEIERDLISQRTKEALARKRSEGFVLGRPTGRKSDRLKLSGHEEEIQSLLDEKVSISAIARRFGVCRKTVISFLKNIKNPA